MIKKLYGINANGERIELNFSKLLMITMNDSHLEINMDTQYHPENPDLSIQVEIGPVEEIVDQPGKLKAIEGHRYLNILPGANNLLFIKVKRFIEKL